MKIEVKDSPQGVVSQIDFGNAVLPSGEKIQDILNENDKLKQDIGNLQTDVTEKSSILAKIVPWKRVRDCIEIVLLLFGVIGIIQTISWLFEIIKSL